MYNWKWLTFHNVVPQLVLHLRQAFLLRIELRSLAELLRVSVFSFIGHFCHEISYVLWVSLESHESPGDALRLASGRMAKHVSLYDKNTQFDPLSLRIDIHLSWTGIHMSWLCTFRSTDRPTHSAFMSYL